jgi:5-methylcytosine-specific restriction endonuclease McrA
MTTGTELTFDDALKAVASLRGHSVRITIMEAGDPPRPIATLGGYVDGQQQDPDLPVVHTRIRRNRPIGSFALERDSGGVAATFRRRALRKTGGRCARCGSRDRVEAHHVLPLLFGGTNDPENAMPLCHECHRYSLWADAK